MKYCIYFVSIIYAVKNASSDRAWIIKRRLLRLISAAINDTVPQNSPRNDATKIQRSNPKGKSSEFLNTVVAILLKQIHFRAVNCVLLFYWIALAVVLATTLFAIWAATDDVRNHSYKQVPAIHNSGPFHKTTSRQIRTWQSFAFEAYDNSASLAT